MTKKRRRIDGPGRGYTLDPKEVNWGERRSMSGKRRLARSSRTLDEQGIGLYLEHEPTGIRVEGSVPVGHYSRSELRTLRQQLHRQLFVELEQRVARHLRIAGR